MPISWMKAPKGTDVATYGAKFLTVDLELGRIYHCNFIVSDVICPIIGVGVFLALHHHFFLRHKHTIVRIY